MEEVNQAYKGLWCLFGTPTASLKITSDCTRKLKTRLRPSTRPEICCGPTVVNPTHLEPPVRPPVVTAVQREATPLNPATVPVINLDATGAPAVALLAAPAMGELVLPVRAMATAAPKNRYYRYQRSPYGSSYYSNGSSTHKAQQDPDFDEDPKSSNSSNTSQSRNYQFLQQLQTTPRRRCRGRKKFWNLQRF